MTTPRLLVASLLALGATLVSAREVDWSLPQADTAKPAPANERTGTSHGTSTARRQDQAVAAVPTAAQSRAQLATELAAARAANQFPHEREF